MGLLRMPAIQASQLKQLAKLNFQSKGITLPSEFNGLPSNHPFKGSDQKAPDPMALFIPPSTLSYHVDSSKSVSKDISDLIDACSDSIGMGFMQWQSAAKFVGVLINGPVGMATPGSIVGPPSMSGPLLLASTNIAGKQPTFIKYVASITSAIGTAFQAWQIGYMATLPFPGGAVCSCTMVPSPNIPMPVAAGSSPGDAMMTAGALKGLMLANHGMPGNHTMDIFDAVSQAFAMLFTAWKGTTMITNILGAGGVAPPPPSPPGPVAAAIGFGGMLT